MVVSLCLCCRSCLAYTLGLEQFPDKNLGAVYFQHPHPELPKLFISELKSLPSSPSPILVSSLLRTRFFTVATRP